MFDSNGGKGRGFFVFAKSGIEVPLELLLELARFEQNANLNPEEIRQFSEQVQQRFKVPVQWRPAP